MEVFDNHQETAPVEYPRIQLLIDKEQDIWKINHFLGKTNSGGADFQQRILESHPDLKGLGELSPEERLPRVTVYIDKFYEDHKENLEKALSQTTDSWEAYAPIFFRNVDKIFKGLKWPPGEYKGFVSISAPCPRFLDSKTFQYPLEPAKHRVFVIAHEMLHFIFYEYVRQRYAPELDNTYEKEMDKLLKGKFSIPLWELAEVFDSAILSQPAFGKEVSSYTLGYPALEKEFVRVKEIWKDANGDIDQFFSEIEKV